MADAPLMVGVSGLRGIVGKSLTPEVAAKFARAFGEWLLETKKRKRAFVVVARDGRAGGETIYSAAIDGLTRSGCSVNAIDVAMTPTAGFVCDAINSDAALIITASHNPQEWNGLKCLIRMSGDDGTVDACAPDARFAAQIIERFRNPGTHGMVPPGKVIKEHGGPFERSHVHAHAGAVVGAIPNARAIAARRFRLDVDSVNASGADGTRELMARLGVELSHHGAERTGVFTHPPEPTRENLTTLCRTVKMFAAAIGFAQDPDGDRLAIVDERGEYIGEEYTLALAAESLLANGKSQIANGKSEPVLVTNLSTSRMIVDVAARHGARVIRTPVGEANVVEAMKRERDAGHNVVLGGEGNGGVIWPKVTYVRDSLSAMALVLALMARTGKKVSELVAAMPRYAIEKRKVDLARKEDAAPAVEKVARAYSSGPTPGRIDRQDGVRVDWDGPLPGGGGGGGAGKAWVHVRASNTEPIMRLIAEAPTADQAKRILDETARVAGV